MRTVRTEPEVDDALYDARRHWGRVDDAWEMIEWVLSRDPTKGAPINEGGAARAFIFDGSRAHEMPNVEIVYVDEPPHYVTIKSARFTDPTYSAGHA